MAAFRIPFSTDALSATLSRLDGEWETYQTSRDRDGIYRYLSALFDIVAVWEVEGSGRKNAGRTLWLRGRRRILRRAPEPFAALIMITSNADYKTRSKWTRVLRYALVRKDTSEAFKKFVKRKGGINACASMYTRYIARQSMRRPPMTSLCRLRQRACP
jgi:hypothetical protein